MPTVHRKVAHHNSSADADRLHDLLMEFVRVAGLLQVHENVSMSQAFALHELDVGDVPLSQRDLAERLRLDKSTVSRLAADLERDGLVVRERDPANRRLYRLRLTDEGRALHRSMRGDFHARYVRWVDSMTRRERDGLLVGLPALLRAVRAGWHDTAGGAERGPDAVTARTGGE
jgi:DNA-binding MarR family transcriptional regulator